MPVRDRKQVDPRLVDQKITPIARGKRLRRLRNMSNLSRHDIEEKYAISANTLKGWEIGRHGGLTERGACKLLTAFIEEHVFSTIDWLLYDIGIGPYLLKENKQIDIPTHKTFEEQTIIHELLLFRQTYPNVTTFVVNDDAMEPCYSRGEYVAGIKRLGETCKRLIGTDCIVQTHDGKLLLRRLHQYAEQGYLLTCLNPHTYTKNPVIYNAQLISAAPVMWQRKKDLT